MFIQQVKLSRDHWSYKLLHYCFPNLQRFNNFCPHFWLTILSLILVIFIFIGRILNRIVFNPIGKAINFVMDKMSDFFSKSKGLKAKKFLDSLSDEQIKKYVYYRRVYDRNMEKISKCEKILCKQIKKYSTDYRDYYNKMHPKIEKTLDLWENTGLNFSSLNFEMKPVITRVPIKETPWYPKAITVTKYSMYLLILPALYLVAHVVYWLALAIGWLWYWIVYAINSPNFWPFVIATGIAAASILSAIVVIFLLIQMFTSLKFKTIIVVCFKPIKWLWKKIISVISFFIIAITQFKQNNCPEIVWTEKENQK